MGLALSREHVTVGHQAKLKRNSKFLIGLTGLVGVIVIFSWGFDIGIIMRPTRHLAAMNPVTALCFILLSLAALLVMSKGSGVSYIIGYLLSCLLIVFVLVHLSDFIIGHHWELDQVLFSKKLELDAANNLSNRMAPNTAINFALAGICLLIIRYEGKLVLIYQGIASVICLIALFSMLGYIYEVKEFYNVLKNIPMAVHTAFCFVIFGGGLLFYSSDLGVINELSCSHTGGAISKVLIPLSIGVPIVLGYVLVLAHWKIAFTVELGAAVLTMSIMVVLIILIWFIIYSLNEKDKIRNEAENRIRLAHSLLQASLESHKDVLIFSIDTNYKYLNYNTAFEHATFSAYGTKIKIGESMLDGIIDPDDRLRAKTNTDKALAGEGHTTIEAYGDLDRNYFETRYTPILNDHSRSTIGVTVLSSNVTDRKIAEEKIVELNKELEAFSYSVAHDLRAPLRIIDGYAGILMEESGPSLDAETNRLLKVIGRNARRMGQLIDDLLSFSKLGRAEVKKSTVDITRMVPDIIEEQKRLIDTREMDIKIGELNELWCDAALMRHVFNNLISNAIKYSQKKERPVIEITSFKEDNDVTYCVKDNGAGFDMLYAEKLFGVFQRLHKVSEFEGTGVGLAIVQRIINKHGGKIWAEGEVDKGATFYFRIPG